MPSIRTESLCFSYGGNDILHDIDLDIEGKGLVCIIGPNGVGKSTLIKCFNGLLRPTSGTVSVNGRPVGDYSVKELSELIGYVPSSTTMSFPMSVIDSVLLGRDSKSKWKLDPSDVLAAYRALKVMRLDDMALRNCNALSAGQMQKVNICRGLVRDSDIFILDEPTSNLDIKHQIFITNFLQILAEESGRLIVMISHDLNIAARFADKVVVLKEPGVLCAYGRPEEVITEEMIRDVYSVSSRIIAHDGRPHVILDYAENW
ncbi:MAG: ABC transporter ATP-binding protein [Candidatus Methanomethylophilaceae archaeon]|nr:ABC transporter ATP-binding protein [Candidatus Methanomethylophilaceae archaeon]